MYAAIAANIIEQHREAVMITSVIEQLPLKNGRICGFSLKISKFCGTCLITNRVIKQVQ
jgi:hypothetical protein